MKDGELLERLTEVAQKLDIELRWDDGDFAGGYCRLGNRGVILMNRSLPTTRQVDILSRGLCDLDLSNVFMLPVVRRRISQASGQPEV
jgi:hypothetical protein